MVSVALLYPEVYDLARFKERRKEFPPFGVLYLAAVAEQAGHPVTLIAVGPEPARLDLRDYDIVGFSLASSATYGTMLAARRAARYRDGAVLLAGGVHANFYPARTLTDFAVHGVAEDGVEDTFLQCLQCLDDPGELAAVPRMWTPGPDGAPRRSPAVGAPKSRDISALPLPARHLLPAGDVVMTDRLAGTDLKMAHVMLSRGCPFPCYFCAAARQVFQWRSGASVRAELIHLRDTYGIEGFAVVDDNFVINPKVVTEVCGAIGDLGLKWSALSRVDRVDDALLATMRAAGCIELKFGIESGSARMLGRMNKGGTASPDVIRTAVRAAARAGIGVKAFVIHGFPGEDDQTTQETIDLLHELAEDIDRVSVFRFVPLPGTHVFRNPDEFGLVGVTAHGPADGRWERFHIHHNDQRWWGSEEDFTALTRSHARLARAVAARWPEPQAIAA